MDRMLAYATGVVATWLHPLGAPVQRRDNLLCLVSTYWAYSGGSRRVLTTEQHGVGGMGAQSRRTWPSYWTKPQKHIVGYPHGSVRQVDVSDPVSHNSHSNPLPTMRRPHHTAYGNRAPESVLEWVGEWRSRRRMVVCVHVQRGSATDLPYDSEYFDAVCTDPPYYDSIHYSKAADFFYVWLKRVVGHMHSVQQGCFGACHHRTGTRSCRQQ